MDFKVSKKEMMMQPEGAVEVLVDNVFDLYPIFSVEDANLIADIEILDDEKLELLDRAMFAAAKQRGQDPLDENNGIQWAEAVIGEVPAPVVLSQVQNAVGEEGSDVEVRFYTTRQGSKEYLTFKIALSSGGL